LLNARTRGRTNLLNGSYRSLSPGSNGHPSRATSRARSGTAATGCPALDAENRPHRGLAQADHRLPAQAVQRITQTDGGRGLALARRRGADGRDQHQLRTRPGGRVAQKALRILPAKTKSTAFITVPAAILAASNALSVKTVSSSMRLILPV